MQLILSFSIPSKSYCFHSPLKFTTHIKATAPFFNLFARLSSISAESVEKMRLANPSTPPPHHNETSKSPLYCFHKIISSWHLLMESVEEWITFDYGKKKDLHFQINALIPIPLLYHYHQRHLCCIHPFHHPFIVININCNKTYNSYHPLLPFHINQSPLACLRTAKMAKSIAKKTFLWTSICRHNTKRTRATAK